MTDTSTLALAEDLIRRPSVTPDDAGCQPLIGLRLAALGFHLEPMPSNGVSNLWARRGTAPPLFCFAGHTDVVPPGPLSDWLSDPFKPEIRDGLLYGRGAADMNQDGRITLNEAYQFAFDGTLARTEKTMASPQHPSYHIQMSGTGDVVITEIWKSSAVLVLGRDVAGTIYIHNRDNVLLVPKDAVEERKGTKMVFTVQEKRVTEKGKSRTVYVAKRHDIEILRENTHNAQVKTPVDLSPGQRVVTQGRQNMEDGARVSVKDSI